MAHVRHWGNNGPGAERAPIRILTQSGLRTSFGSTRIYSNRMSKALPNTSQGLRLFFAAITFVFGFVVAIQMEESWFPVEIKIGFQPTLGQCRIFKICLTRD